MDHHSDFRLLLVSDNRSLQRDLATGLEPFGFEVVSAVRSYEAVMQYKACHENPGAILVDHESEATDAANFVRYIRRFGYAGRIVVICDRLTRAELRRYASHRVCGFFTHSVSAELLAYMLLPKEQIGLSA